MAASSPLGDKADTARLITLRHTAGWLSIVAGVVVLAALIAQITDQLAVGRFQPTQYFAYLTVQVAMISVVVLISGGIYAARGMRSTPLYTAIRASVVAYALFVAIVYNLLLRDIPHADGYVGPGWADDALHVWIPLYFLVDWLLSPGRARIGWSTVLLALSFPLVWVGVTLTRGWITGWYPHSFLRPDGPDGIIGLVIHVGAIAVATIALSMLIVLVNRVHTRGVRDVGHGRRQTGPIPVVRADLR